MREVIPAKVNSALLYFHSARSSGEEIAPFLPELEQALPHTYIWAGDGVIEGAGAPIPGNSAGYGASGQRFWFVFPMTGDSEAAFLLAKEAMGAVQLSCGGYINAFVDGVMARFGLPAERVVLCGHQHGACVALAAAMMRRHDPFALTVLFDPWPWEAFYLQHEQDLPVTQVVCVDNLWVRERERARGGESARAGGAALFQVFKDYGVQASGVTLPTGEGIPDQEMFREAARLLKRLWAG